MFGWGGGRSNDSAWFQNCRRLVVRYERFAENFLVMYTCLTSKGEPHPAHQVEVDLLLHSSSLSAANPLARVRPSRTLTMMSMVACQT